jgi:hypothetical protein
VSDRRATGQGGGPIRGGRRAFLRAVGAGSVALEAGLSGCLDRFSGDDSDGDDGPPDAEPTLFADDFEEASMADDVTRDLPINADGFVWRSNNRTAAASSGRTGPSTSSSRRLTTGRGTASTHYGFATRPRRAGRSNASR